ncbi:hypothetical protein CSKR_102520 [Clonorchis sinensis]|uniref:Uncharacterized protein n=1 Tax=Clonorchis sinensis TaxID=79923 RepID=A0A3R7DN82_CLOSI|nr:hypothetical protein CSKR_102520 [Clonorchis sinensis]
MHSIDQSEMNRQAVRLPSNRVLARTQNCEGSGGVEFRQSIGIFKKRSDVDPIEYLEVHTSNVLFREGAPHHQQNDECLLSRFSWLSAKDIFEKSQISKSFLASILVMPSGPVSPCTTKAFAEPPPNNTWTHFSSSRGRWQSDDHCFAAIVFIRIALAFEPQDSKSVEMALATWLEREFTDRKFRGSNPTSASRLPLSRPGQPGSISTLVQLSGGMTARY